MRVDDRLPDQGIVRAAELLGQGDEPRRVCAARAAGDGRALAGQGGLRDAPPLPWLPHHVGDGDPDLVEEHLAEVGVAGHLAQGADVDPGRRHVDQQVGDAPVLGPLGVGARQEDPPLRPIGRRGPDLLARDHPLVAVEHGAGGHVGQVGAGLGLAEELAPHLVTPEHGGQVALLLRIGAVREQRRADHADRDGEDAVGHAEAGLLLVEDHRLDRLARRVRRPPSAR